MDCGYFKDLPRRAAPDKVLHDTTFNIAKNPKCDQKHKDHVSMVIAKTFLSATHTGTGINSNLYSENQQLTEELSRHINRKF